MKHLKKIVSLTLTLVMVFAMTLSINAASVTVTGDTNGYLNDHTYSAYQIFTGKYESGELKNIQWGSGINTTDFVAALQASTAKAISDDPNTTENEEKTLADVFANRSTAAEVAEGLSLITETDAKEKVAEFAYKNKVTASKTDIKAGETAELVDGYYLIVDTTNFGEDATDTVYNAALLQVVGDLTINLKTDKPTVEKKVDENHKETSAADSTYGDKWNDVADYSIGDDVKFELIGSIPDMSQYESYTYTFIDTLNKGFDDPKDITVYLSNDKIVDGNDKILSDNRAYSVTGPTDTENGGKTFSVDFGDLKSVVGNSTEYKYVIVSYTAKLNTEANVGSEGNENFVYLEYSNNPNESGKGKTVEDKVVVFTYEVDVTKIDAASTENNKITLKDAKFTIQRTTDNKYAVVDDTTGKISSWTDNEAEAHVFVTGDDGLIKVVGLDEGTYKLTEIEAPKGYNKPDNPFELVVTASDQSTQESYNTPSEKYSELTGTLNSKEMAKDATTGILEGTIENTSGATLPETGGVGTTMFYVVGGLLVAFAGVLFAKRRNA